MSVIIEGIKAIIWVLIILVVAYFIMTFKGYQINNEYFIYTKKQCQAKLKECSELFLQKGIKDTQCQLECVDPKLIIKKR